MESFISRESHGASDVAHTTDGTDKDQGPQSASSVEHRVSLGPANRRAANRSGETTGATEEELSDGHGSARDSGDESDSEDSHYNTDTENPPLQGYQDEGSGPKRGGLELQNVPNLAARGMADDTKSLYKSTTGGNGERRKSMEVSFEFEPNFHTDAIIIPSAEPSSPEMDIDNTETSGNTGIPITESGTRTHIHQKRAQTETSPNIPPGGQYPHSSPPSSDSNPSESPVREALEEVDIWLRPLSEEGSERSNPLRDPPPPRYRPLWSSTASQAPGTPNHEPGSSLSVGPGFRAVNSQTMNRDGNAAAIIAREASSLLAQRWAGEPLTRPPYRRNHLWQATVMDVEDDG